MISATIVEAVDKCLDANVAPVYKQQPMAQHWARIAKGKEEDGEAIEQLILATGQNPRKPLDPDARMALLLELADAALTRVYAIQHFTKDIELTAAVMEMAQHKHFQRTMPDEDPVIKL